MVITNVDEPQLEGAFSCAASDERLPGVLALGGSEGGIPTYLLRLLAEERFACLAVAYFNTPKTQPALTEVPLERIERALRWLRDNPKVDSRDGRVAVLGASKGGELALLVAATFPNLVGPVVAYTPSSVVWAGIDFSPFAPPVRSSWSLAGTPLTFVPFPQDVGPAHSERGVSMLPIYERGLDRIAADDPAIIPIERAKGPVLLVSGRDDRMWPAHRMCRMIVDRMRRAGRGQVRHLDFPDAGHVLFPFEPGPGALPVPLDLGGSAAAAASAHQSAWPQVVRTLAGELLAV